MLSKYRAFVLAYMIGLLAVQGFLVARYARGELINIASAVFHIVGVYAIIVGLMLRSRFALVTEALTSANPLIFAAGNTALLPLATSVLRLLSKCKPEETPLYRLIRWVLATSFLIVCSVFLLFHILVIVPLAWLAYLVGNVTTDLVLTSGLSIRHTVGANLEVMRKESILHDGKEPLDAEEEQNAMTVREFFTQNRGQAVSFLVGAPSIIFGVILKLIAVF